MAEDYTLDRSEKFSRPAEFRAPSLGLAELGFLAPKSVELNPLISVGAESKPAPLLDWNVAFPQSTAKKSGGRDEPRTGDGRPGDASYLACCQEDDYCVG